MSRLEKPTREIDLDYLGFVRSHPCAVCNVTGVEAHHLKTRASGGSDYTSVPLCASHHSEWHQLGNREFTDRHGVNLWRTNADLLRRYIGQRLRRDPS